MPAEYFSQKNKTNKIKQRKRITDFSSCLILILEETMYWVKIHMPLETTSQMVKKKLKSR
jgi:hypothetical protein